MLLSDAVQEYKALLSDVPATALGPDIPIYWRAAWDDKKRGWLLVRCRQAPAPGSAITAITFENGTPRLFGSLDQIAEALRMIGQHKLEAFI